MASSKKMFILRIKILKIKNKPQKNLKKLVKLMKLYQTLKKEQTMIDLGKMHQYFIIIS